MPPGGGSTGEREEGQLPAGEVGLCILERTMPSLKGAAFWWCRAFECFKEKLEIMDF